MSPVADAGRTARPAPSRPPRPPPQVLSYDPLRRLHHLLYLDGENEWLDLGKEAAVWTRAPVPGAAIAAGALGAEGVPQGRAALGWRVAVYWRDDRAFYEGVVVQYDPGSGRHRWVPSG